MIIHRKIKSWLDKFKPGTRFKYLDEEGNGRYRIYMVIKDEVEYFTDNRNNACFIATDCLIEDFSDKSYSKIETRFDEPCAPCIYSFSNPESFQNQIVFIENDKT